MELHTPQSLLSVHGFADYPHRPGALRRYVMAFVERLREAHQRSLDREKLMSMSERDLADIGLVRADVVSAYHGAPWPFQNTRGGRGND